MEGINKNKEGNMTLKKNVYIETHENVTIEYETANLGSRFLARLLDEVIVYAALIITVIILSYTVFENSSLNLSNIVDSWNILYVIAIVYIVTFILKYFYFVIFEMTMRGQSPGKKAAGLRVVSTTGEPIIFSASLVRNLLRIVDDLPANYLVGAVFIMFNKKSQRLGDIAANTMVIKTKENTKFTKQLEQMLQDEINNEVDMQEVLDKYLESSENIKSPDETIPEETNATISKHEYEILSEYLAQREFIHDSNIWDVKLFNYFFRRVNAQIPQRMYYAYVIQFLIGVERYNRQFYT